MTTTLKDSLPTLVTNFFVDHVSTHLSEWLKENKDLEVTPKEICGAFEVEYNPRPTMSGLPQSAHMTTQMPQVPGYYHGTGGPSPSKRGGGGRKKAAPAAAVDPNGPKCKYTFQRGGKKGTECGEPCAGDDQPGGNEYCKTCIKKKTVMNRVQTGSNGKSTVNPPTIPGGTVQIPDEEDDDNNNNTINAIPIEGEEEGMFRDTDNGFIIKSQDDGNIIALAMEDENGRRPLTADERKKAQKMGLAVLEPELEKQPVHVPQMPQVPQIPTFPSATGIPVAP
jgi:hypothetical protein